MTEIKKQVKQLSRTQVGVSLTKEDREIIKAEVGSIVSVSLDNSSHKFAKEKSK